jgi:hypothetical protein
MPLPASTTSLPFVLDEVQRLAQVLKAEAQNANAFLAAQNVDSDWVFRFLDRFYSLGAALNAWAATPGLDAYATANINAYSGTLTTDIAATIVAGQAVINWIVTNFPKDSTGNFVLSHTINANGSRTPRQFTPTDTTGLRTALSAFIATVG